MTSPQNIAWFWDQLNRQQLDLEPPYQRRSVWNQKYREEFIDTITLGYPCPEIFLYPEIAASGATTYHVVDGKQRLETIFMYLGNDFALPDTASLADYRGRYFEQLTPEQKKAIWSYQLTVVQLPTSDEVIINDVFNRINKNVARLTRQELRHAKYSGVFITAVEALTDWFNAASADFPRIAQASRKQMRDVELVATLCLLLEDGVQSYSADDLDAEFTRREDDWPARFTIEERFKRDVECINQILDALPGENLRQTRLRNIVDYYSLFGAVDRCIEAGTLREPGEAAERVIAFMHVVEDPDARPSDALAQDYYEAARSATNDVGSRNTRINIVAQILST